MKHAMIGLFAATPLWACYPGSDAESFHREWEKDRQRRIAAMREATRTTPAGRRVEGAALQQLLSGRTHVFIYGTTPDGRRQRYVEFTTFRAGGQFVYRNTLWAVDPNGRPDDHWRVDGKRLCILNSAFSQVEQCYTLAVRDDAQVQYFIDRPGDQTDGLLTKVTSEVHEGEPPVGK